MKPTNIILDLGMVIIDVDYAKTAAAFRDLGIDDFDEVYSKKKQTSFFDDFEKGTLSVDGFRLEVRKHLDENISDNQIDHAWNAMIGRIPKHRFKFLMKLSSEYDLYLLSNTNKLHIPAFSKVVEEDFGLEKFYSFFKKVYLSCELGMRKPDREIFDLLINENTLNKDECIFIDDTLHHVEGGKTAGIQSYHLKDGVDIIRFLPEILSAD